MDRNYQFKKYERLKGKQEITKVFKKGCILQIEFLKMIYLKKTPDQKGTQIGISVPKKFVKKAVARNQIKRRLRSAYRVNKYLLNKSEINYSIFFIWTNKELSNFQKIEKFIKRSFYFLIKENR